MSDNDTLQYWRILKKDNGVVKTLQGTPIKEGDEVRFAWAFEDQTVGFRDYLDDVFGRRRNQVPSELSKKVLYLKMPWPRFERYLDGQSINSMLLSEIDSVDRKYADVRVVPGSLPTTEVTEVIDEVEGQEPAKEGEGVKNISSRRYILEDVSFRIDPVANDGRGDVDDYLLRGLMQHTPVPEEVKPKVLSPFTIEMIVLMFWIGFGF